MGEIKKKIFFLRTSNRNVKKIQIIILMHRFKLAQMKMPGPMGYSGLKFYILHLKIKMVFTKTRNGNIIVFGMK
jgi:hypothetical protein